MVGISIWNEGAPVSVLTIHSWRWTRFWIDPPARGLCRGNEGGPGAMIGPDPSYLQNRRAEVRVQGVAMGTNYEHLTAEERATLMVMRAGADGQV
jgi:hypothetical protein